MPDDQKTKLRLEIAHVLFMDIVGYSKLLTDEQSEALQELNQIVRNTEAARDAEAAGQLVILPTGDGMALVFTGSVEEPAECALEVSQALRAQPSLPVRMGIHSGPVHHVKDANGRDNIAGIGINIAQRVMDCGDAGHILVSKRVADDLGQHRRWQPYLHDLGDVEVKHGVVVSLVNLYAETIGNPAPPARMGGKTRGIVRAGRRKGLSPVMRAIFIIAGLIITLTFALAIASVIFVPAILRSLERNRAAPSAPAIPPPPSPPSIGEEIQNAINKKIRDKLQEKLPAKSDAPSIPSAPPEPSPPPQPGSPIPEKSIAVLPFENLSDDKANAYFAEGIQDEILTRLSKIAAIKVISRTSTRKYKSAPDNLREVGQQLGVANVLEGSVQKAGNAVHINVQLIKAATDEHMWAESYDRELHNIFGVEGEVAGAVADALRAKLTGSEKQQVVSKPTQNPAAYDAYLRGVSIQNMQFGFGADENAAKAYAQAVQLDPRFALAWANLAIVRSPLYLYGVDPRTNSPEAIREAADKAMALQPELAEAWAAQGAYRYRVGRDFRGALQAYEEARKRFPNSSRILMEIAVVETRLGSWKEAEGHWRKAMELDPRNPALLASVAGEFLNRLRRFSEPQTLLNRALELSPGDDWIHTAKANGFQYEGRLTEAAKELARFPADSTADQIVAARFDQFTWERQFDNAIDLLQRKINSLTPGEPVDEWAKIFITELGYCQEWAGKMEEAKATFTRAVREIKPTNDSVVPVKGFGIPIYLALAYAGLGEKEKALDQAHRAIEEYADDGWVKPAAEAALAQIQARFGEIEAAIAAIPHLLEVPAGITRADLRFDPFWDPLRKEPRFQKLCQEKEP